VTRDWRKLHNEELHFYSSLNIVRVINSRRMRWAEHVARVLEKINVYRVLAGKPEGNSPFGNTSGRWEVIVKLVLKEMGW
jgi:hypothetical protein